MTDQIIKLGDWLKTPPGLLLQAWEEEQFDETVADIFGYHALQLGCGPIDALRTNRMPHRWQARSPDEPAGPAIAFATDFAALPFGANSLDLVALPHTLELAADPHATLREVERVLVPEGRVIVCGLNPASLWGLRQRRARLYRHLGGGELYLPGPSELINYWRLRDWLRLLGFEVESSRFGLYRPAVRSEAWLQRCRWMDELGERWWPIFGAAYFVVAVKRVRGMRLLPADWKRRPAMAAAPRPVAGRISRTGKKSNP